MVRRIVTQWLNTANPAHQLRQLSNIHCNPSRRHLSSAAWPLIAAQACSRVCYEENGEGGFTSDLSTSVSSSFTSFFAFLITFFASFLTSFFFCFDFFPLPAIASSRAARQTTLHINSSITKRPHDEASGQLPPQLLRCLH